ncbi:MAG: hypothetical protein CEE42_04975 [Promethearchaeota archaeon Loki_b31]|nr:MAG: hypothetical protein CEE42_04975 [Candidatus Lokiarchaeota archaeon Loki_b31]
MKIDIEVLKKLEKSIDTSDPEKGEVPIKILGYGEISLVFELLNNPEQIAYKRIPIFDNETQVERHIWAYNEYNRLLKEDVGLNLPEYDVAWFKDEEGKIQFYCVQEKLPSESVGHKVIHQLSDQDIKSLILLVMREMKKVWDYSKNHNNIDLGLDGQISNFAIIGFDPNNPKVDLDTKLMYFDTSTPMFRVNGNEAMEAVLFLKSAPSFLRWLLKALFLEETVGRYYDWRKVTIDLVANFFKEQKPELIPELINLVNKFFEEEAIDFDIEPLTLEEVKKYYKSDSSMWVIFQSVRRFDRFLKTKVFKKKYDFYLPGKIER